MTRLKMADQDAIQPRQVGDPVPEVSSLDPGLGQYQFGDLPSYIEFAKVMCQAGPMLPEHAKNNPAICLALTMRAVHWGFDPFALAFESFQAKQGGPVGFQAKVFTAVLRKAGVKLRYRYEGEVKMLDQPVKSYKGNEVAKRTATGNRKCIAYIIEDGDELAYETLPLDDITIKNSPLWHNDPDQQLAYAAGRGWARRYRPDLMMGAYSDEEVQSFQTMRDVTPKESGFARLGQQARSQAATGAQDTPDTQHPPEGDNGTTEPAPTGNDADPGDASPDDAQDAAEEHEINPDSPAYQMGADAAREGFIGRDQSPFNGNDEAAAERANWLAGFDSVETTE